MTVKKALGLISDKFKDPSQCSRCGSDFTCGAKLTGCWCMNVKLSDKARAELKENFRNCLCQSCLKDYSEPVNH